MSSSNPSILTAPKAAEYLAQAVGGKAIYWEIWLANERRPNRVNRMLERIPGPGRPRYSEEALMAFVPLYNAKFAGKAGAKSSTARKTAQLGAHAYAHTEAANVDDRCVLFVTVNPLKTYKMSASEARHLANKLIAAANEVDASIATHEAASK